MEVESTPPGELYKGRTTPTLPERSLQPPNGVPPSSLPSGHYQTSARSARSGRAQRNSDPTQPRSGIFLHTANTSPRHPPSDLQTNHSLPHGSRRSTGPEPPDVKPNDNRTVRDTHRPPMIADFFCPQGLRLRPAQRCTGSSDPRVPITVDTATPMGCPQGPQLHGKSQASGGVIRTRNPTRRDVPGAEGPAATLPATPAGILARPPKDRPYSPQGCTVNAAGAHDTGTCTEEPVHSPQGAPAPHTYHTG